MANQLRVTLISTELAYIVFAVSIFCSTIVNAKAFSITKAFFHAKTPRAETPSTSTKSCTIYFPCLYIVCYTNAIISVDCRSIWASGTRLITVSIPLTCINVNNIPK